MMQITDYPYHYPSIIHGLSDVINRNIHIIQKCASKQKDTNMSIHFITHSIDNRVFRDNSLGGQWIKGGQRADNAQTNGKMRFFNVYHL